MTWLDRLIVLLPLGTVAWATVKLVFTAGALHNRFTSLELRVGHVEDSLEEHRDVMEQREPPHRPPPLHPTV